METEILFHSEPFFAGDVGQVDQTNYLIKGVSIISAGEAQGHGLVVDKETLNQLHALAVSRKRVPVNLDHGSGIEKTCGYLENFRLDGDKIRGDWQLLKNHSEAPLMLERAERMPDCFGMSCAFKGSGQAMPGGKKAARAEKLLSVDCVCRPATGDGGLFAAKDETVDMKNKFKMETPAGKETQDPTLADVMKAIEGLKAHVEQIDGVQNQLIDHINSQVEDGAKGQDDRAVLEQLYNATDAQLAELNLTRQEVDAAVAEYNASATGGEEGDKGGGNGDDGKGGEGTETATGAPTGELAGVSQEAPATFSAMQRRIIQLEAKLNARDQREKQSAEELQFAEVEEKIGVLATREKKAIELAEKLVVENEALKIHLSTGTRPVRPGVDNGVRLFSANGDGELHEFQQLVKKIVEDKKVSEGTAIQLALKEPNGPALHADWLQKQTVTTIHA